jgi:hypothetical protein
MTPRTSTLVSSTRFCFLSQARHHPGYFLVRITPTPILLRKRSGYFSRAFSACSFVLNGLDKGVNSGPTYWKSNHRSMIFDISNL